MHCEKVDKTPGDIMWTKSMWNSNSKGLEKYHGSKMKLYLKQTETSSGSSLGK